MMNFNPRSHEMTTQYKMLSDNFITRFRSFMAAENHNPAGAFDAMPKAQPRKENQMSAGYRYVPLQGTGNSLFLRERSNVMAYDEAGKDPNEMANVILEFLSSRLSDDDMRQVKEYLMIEAGEKPDNVKEAEQMAKASASRGAQDSASARSGQAGFDARFPSARKIGRDDMIGTR
jgi:hypothetical protein